MTPKILYIILFILAGAVGILAKEVAVQHQENKDLLGRRDRTEKPVPPAEENTCSRQCALYCTLEDTVIPELKSEAKHWQISYEDAMKQYAASERRNRILQSTIAKLRTSKEDK